MWSDWPNTPLFNTDIVRVPDGARYGAGRDGKAVGELPIDWVRWNLNRDRIWIERDGKRLKPSGVRDGERPEGPAERVVSNNNVPVAAKRVRAARLYDPWGGAMPMAAPDPKPVVRNRPCLVCRTRTVGSTGPGHRICDYCRYVISHSG